MEGIKKQRKQKTHTLRNGREPGDVGGDEVGMLIHEREARKGELQRD